MSLCDVSFLIPLRIDSEERGRHCNFVVKYLRSNFPESTLIIYEDDCEPKIDSYINKSLLTECQYKFIHNQSKNFDFHKTKILNQMVLSTTNPIIAEHDSDVFLSSSISYVLAAEAIRNEDSYFCIPFEEYVSFAVDSDEFYKHGDMKHLRQTIVARATVGCIGFFNRLKLIENGMWNEEFKTWGYEDNEIDSRMSKLGAPPTRINQSSVYHLEHPRLKAGFYDFQNGQDENRGLKEKLDTLSAEELKEIIKNWSWVQKAKDT